MKKFIDIPAILVDVHEKLNRRFIFKVNGYPFSAKDLSRIICFFEKEQAAQEVTYPALIQLQGRMYDGEITISRDGRLQVRLDH